jgi:hypothetical protein
MVNLLFGLIIIKIQRNANAKNALQYEKYSLAAC